MVKMNRYFCVLFSLLLCVPLISGPGCSRDKYFSSPGSGDTDAGKFSFLPGCGEDADYSLEKASAEDLQGSVKLAAGYLARICRPDGQFEYSVNLDPTVRFVPSYNMLRHAGTLYALAVYAGHSGDRSVRQVILNAAGFLKERIITPVEGRDDLLAAGPLPDTVYAGSDHGFKLGGAGLSLVALCEVERVIPGTTPAGYLKKLGRFIVYMQKKDGSFYSKYNREEGAPDESWVSLYYPGEAALGLLMLYGIDKSPEWLQAASNAISYLANSRAGSGSVPADHWALIATAELLPLYNQCSNTLPRKAVIEHAVKICRAILSADPGYSVRVPEYGSLTLDAVTCQTATRLEGLLAALTFLPDEYETLREEIKSAAGKGIGFLLRSQVKDGPYAGAIPRSIRPMSKSHPHYNEHSSLRAGEVRIDYVQHAMCAIMQHERLLKLR